VKHCVSPARPRSAMTRQEKQEFDFVIVGAGASAMGLVNGLLSRFKKDSPSFTIAVLERGNGPPHANVTASPNRWCDASHKESSSVQLVDSLIGNRVVDIPVGKGLGGTTNVNACLCTAPARDDFSAWPAPWKDSIFRSVGVIQEEMIANDALYYHDTCDNPYESGAWKDSKTTTSFERETVFPSLITRVPLSVAKKDDGTFLRRNYYDALVEPLLRDHPHLTDFITFHRDFEVQSLLFDEHDLRVIGVEGPKAIYARREVIVCAGAIESPALLLVSGIGHAQDLKQAGVRPIRKASCTGVGRRLRDHVLVPRVVLSPWAPRTLSPNGVHAIYYTDKGEYRYQFILNDAAVYSQLVPHFVASFVRRRISHPAFIMATVNFLLDGLFRCLRFLFMLLISYTPLYFVLCYFVITVNIALLNPRSTGRVAIRRRQAGDNREQLRRKDVHILVNAGYLSDPEDVTALFIGWNTCTQRFESFLSRCVELLPGFFFRGVSLFSRQTPHAKWFHKYASHFGLPYFHWCGTCAMQTEENAEWVVDSCLRVRDIPGLRVCDASVFPTTISGPTALTCAALGHGLANLLLLNTEYKKDI